jgi:hypothetical protein
MRNWIPPTRGFETLTATVRDWSNYARVIEIQRQMLESDAGAGERLYRVHVGPASQVREEALDTGKIWIRASGDIRDNASHWPLFLLDWLLDHPPLKVIGERVVDGRRGIAVESIGADGPAAMLLPGANRCVAVVDQERAVILRCEAWLDDELLMVEELTEVRFDDPLRDRLFVEGGEASA